MRERKKWEVAHTMERKRRKIKRKPKRTPHPCGNMSQGREEEEGLEPPNLFAPIVKRHTRVHLPV